MTNKCLSIQVSGRVQGVAFRHHTQKTAEKMGIKGYVKNMPDGSVYMEACGEESKMELFTDWCSKGPSLARVTNIHINDIPEFQADAFTVRY